MDSVLSQSYGDIEYIIIDGNSQDKTLEIIKLKAQTHQNIFWISEKDNGIYDALNKGLKMASGDIIGFVHSDDFLANDKVIENIAQAFKLWNIDGLYGNLHYITDDNRVVRNWISRPFLPKLLEQGWMPAHPTVFLKKKIYKKHGFFNTKYKISADYDFILRIFKDESYFWYYLSETIMKMRMGGVSNNGFRNLIKKTKEDYSAAIENNLRFPKYAILLKNITKIKQLYKKG